MSPPYALQPEVERSSRRLAHSLRLALPSTTMPASRSRATSGASSRGGGMSASASEPAVVARPAVSMLSFTSTGMPCSGPRTCPSAALGIAARGVVEGVGVERADGVDQRVDRLDPVESGFDQLRVLALMGGVMALDPRTRGAIGHDLAASARRW